MARILVVDDDINLLQMVKIMLQRVGHQVQTAINGAEGISIATETQPDVAIIDVMMPDLSGYDVVRKLRDNAATTAMPIIILTARSQPMDKHMALEAGANAFISKPVTAQELTDRVDAVLKAGVNYRVHTGLLTEPVHRGTPSQPKSPADAAVRQPMTPATGLPRLDRKPIGAEDARPSEPVPPTARMPVMTIAGLRGGTGSTTIAINLAFLLAARGRRVCLVDLSTASGHIPLHLHLAPPQNWGALLNLGDSPDPRAVTSLLVQHHPTGIAVLAAPSIPTMQTLSTVAVQNVLTHLGSAFQHVIVDAPGLDPGAVGALLMARSVVVVMSDDPPSIQTTGQFMVALQNAGVEIGRVRVVVNHIRPTPDVPAETIQKALKRPLSADIPYDHNQLTAIRRGLPLVAADPASAFASSIEALARTMTL